MIPIAPLMERVSPLSSDIMNEHLRSFIVSDTNGMNSLMISFVFASRKSFSFLGKYILTLIPAGVFDASMRPLCSSIVFFARQNFIRFLSTSIEYHRALSSNMRYSSFSGSCRFLITRSIRTPARDPSTFICSRSPRSAYEARPANRCIMH